MEDQGRDVEELRVILGEAASTLTVNGTPLKVKPLTMKDIPDFMVLVGPIVGRLTASDSALSRSNIAKVLLDYPKEVRAAVALGSGLTPEVIDALNFGEFVVVASAVFSENLDVFLKGLAHLGVRAVPDPGLPVGQSQSAT